MRERLWRPGPEFGPGRGFHRASDGGVMPLRPRRVTTRLRRISDVATAAAAALGPPGPAAALKNKHSTHTLSLRLGPNP